MIAVLQNHAGFVLLGLLACVLLGVSLVVRDEFQKRVKHVKSSGVPPAPGQRWQGDITGYEILAVNNGQVTFVEDGVDVEAGDDPSQTEDRYLWRERVRKEMLYLDSE